MQVLTKFFRALADETRLHILMTLLEGEMTVSDLVARLGLTQPRVSTHLALLRDADAVLVDTDGRQRTYRLNLERLRTVLPELQVLTLSERSRPPLSSQAASEVRRNTAIRQARTCYDHLAGTAGVELLDELLSRRMLEVQGGSRPLYDITPEGTRVLTERRVDIPRVLKSRRMFAFGCLDWTERRPHLGGALGAGILEALESAGVIRKENGFRTAFLLGSVADWLDKPGLSKPVQER